MNQDTLVNDALIPESPLSHSRMTRRHMLRTLTQSSLALGVGGALLTACGTDTNANPAVTLLLGESPIKASVITSKKALTDPDDIAEKEVINDWLAKNKNVTFKSTAIDLSTDQKIQAALAARTAPTITSVFTDLSLNRSASKVKYAADVTDFYHKYDLDNKMADYAKPIFTQNYNLDGKYYALPGDGVSGGSGLFYRRDLLKAKGIDEPQLGWTWKDFFNLIRQFQQDGKPVMGAPYWMFGWVFNANMLDLQPTAVLGSVPAPKSGWHWQAKLDPWIDEWKQLTELYRKAAIDDNLIEQNKTAYPWEGPAMGKYASGQYPFSPGYAFQGTISGYAPVTPVEMPAKFNKTFDELVGFIPYPKGSNGGYNSGAFANMTGQQMFPHYLKPEVLEKAVDLYLYRIYGDGYLKKYAKKYDLTKNPVDAYKFIAPANKYQKNPLLPADITVENAFGPRWVNSYMGAIRHLPPMPSLQVYFPVDTKTGPTGAAHTDLLDKLSQSKEDVTGLLKNFQDTYNGQASSMQSDISPEVFTAAAKKYFGALNNYFKLNLPDFYDGDWSKYYKEEVTPALA